MKTNFLLILKMILMMMMILMLLSYLNPIAITQVLDEIQLPTKHPPP